MMEAKPRLLAILEVITILLFVIAVAAVFFYAPTRGRHGAGSAGFLFSRRQCLGRHAGLHGGCQRGGHGFLAQG